VILDTGFLDAGEKKEILFSQRKFSRNFPVPGLEMKTPKDKKNKVRFLTSINRVNFFSEKNGRRCRSVQ
jgi:hypothetical protein